MKIDLLFLIGLLWKYRFYVGFRMIEEGVLKGGWIFMVNREWGYDFIGDWKVYIFWFFKSSIFWWGEW